jgi:hypothetical protein
LRRGADTYANSEDLEENDRGDDQALVSFILWRAAAGWNRGETGCGPVTGPIEFSESRDSSFSESSFSEFSESLQCGESSREGMEPGQRIP